MRRIGPYDIEAELGHGGMGRVYRARHRPTGVLRAVKTLEGSGVEDLARFERESVALARAAGEGIVAIHESGREGRTVWYAMDLMPNGSLRARIEGKRLPWREACELVRELAHGLGRCHARGLVHRDLKPENILFDDRDRPRLADFGCVRDLAASRLTESGTVLGTPAYMAPEQLEGRPVDPRADVFALGVILYELVTGRRPFAGRTIFELARAISSGAHEPPSRLAGSPAGLDALVRRTLAAEPSARPAGANELARELEELAGVRPAPRRRSPVLLVSVFGVACAAALLGSTLRFPAPAERPGTPRKNDAPARHVANPLALDTAAAIARIASEQLAALGRPLSEELPAEPLRGLVKELAHLASEERDPAERARIVAPIASAVRWAVAVAGPRLDTGQRRYAADLLRLLPQSPTGDALQHLLGAHPAESVGECSDAWHRHGERSARLALSRAKDDPVLALALAAYCAAHPSSSGRWEETREGAIADALALARSLYAQPRDPADDRWARESWRVVLDCLAKRERTVGTAPRALELDLEAFLLVTETGNPPREARRFAGLYGRFVVRDLATARDVAALAPPVEERFERSGELEVETHWIRACRLARAGQAPEARQELERARASNGRRPKEPREEMDEAIAALEAQLGR